MVLDKKQLGVFRKEIQEKLDEYAKEKGVQINIGNITYDSVSFVAKVKVVLAGNKEEAERLEFEKIASLFGLKKEDYGKKIKLRILGEEVEYKLIGLRPKSHKFPLIAKKEGHDGRFKLPLNDAVKKELGIDDEHNAELEFEKRAS